ncbi:glycosyl transferase [Thermoleophilia bacterium SCSIO 60948]|nr:glycosyl transferase [Thermoleophilia bacterium SCSIO 60948]
MSQRSRKRHHRSRGSALKLIGIAMGVFVLIVGIALAGVGLWVQNVVADVSIDELKPIKRGETSKIYASDGSLLGAVPSDTIREPAKLEEIPKSLQQATIAIEDENFYDHSGVDFGAVVRAAIVNFEAGEVRQGGSTITQQLVKNLYIADPDETVERKIIEAELARQYEEEHTKRYILGQYLNTATYGTNGGRTAVGVKVAARVYFSKDLKDLDLDESALLAGMPQAPSEYNPFLNPDDALARRNLVLRAMRDEGYIDQNQYVRARKDGLGLEQSKEYEEIKEPDVFNFVLGDLIDRYGVNTVRNGGLKVYTTVDPDLQALASDILQSQYPGGSGPAGAIASVDVDSGDIIAIASSRGTGQEQFNVASQGHRQPGSSFKTFVLTEAVLQGADPDSTFYNAYPSIDLTEEAGTPFPVQGTQSGSLSLRTATTSSDNTVFAQLGLDVGPENTAELAGEMGVDTKLDGLPAEALGGLTIGVSPLEMADAYATLASGGVHHEQTAIDRVEFPNGEVDEPEQQASQRVFSDGVAATVTDVLESNVEGGTGTEANYGCPAAGKTGTTDANADVWFVGYTPNVSTAVWVGYPDATTSLGSASFGGTISAPLWNQFMSQADPSCDDFPEPQNPADLGSFSGSLSGSSGDTSSSTTDTTDATGVSPVTPAAPTDTTTPAAPDADADGDGFDDGAYAPGVQDP